MRVALPVALSLVASFLFSQAPGAAAPEKIRYAAIGDSYSSGEGASPELSWPALLARHLRASGLDIDLVANPSRTGWTTGDAIDSELPVFIQARPDFATLQIGVNDWVQGVDAATFQKHLVILLDKMLAVLPDRTRLLVVTIPDFSVTPAGASFGGGRDISAGLAAFNAIILHEAEKRGVKAVDIFGLSRHVRDDPGLVAEDGLHPSAKEYAAWEKLIFPAARKLLSD
ncbi:MAG: SGNH/GDSL hydrolase family protein [Chthoniobacteraceae bacterium]